MRSFLFIALLVVATTAASATTAPVNVAAWRADLDTLERELPIRHPAPFANVPRVRWHSAATALERRLPAMSRNQAIVGFMRLVALVGDAHTDLDPGPALGLRFYPLELYSFDDGLFVRRADSTHAALVGANALAGSTALSGACRMKTSWSRRAAVPSASPASSAASRLRWTARHATCCSRRRRGMAPRYVRRRAV